MSVSFSDNGNTVEAIIGPSTFDHHAVFICENTFAVLLVHDPLAFVLVTFIGNIDSVTVAAAFSPVTIVMRAIIPNAITNATSLVVVIEGTIIFADVHHAFIIDKIWPNSIPVIGRIDVIRVHH